jgi:hypothetical protein
MTPRFLLSTFALVAFAGCNGQPSSETPADHPARTAAAEAPAPARSQALHDPVARSEASAAAQPSTAPVVYTCPHHPEVTSNEPGVCPKCEMRLQPKKPDTGNAPPAGAHDGHGGHGGH